MSQVPVQVVIAAFQSETKAKHALDQLESSQRDGLIHIRNAAVLRRDHDGKLHVSETRDWSGKRGLAVGGLLGAVVGVLAGPVGLAAGAGAAIGGLAARLRDSGFSDDRLRRIGDGLLPGTSALVAVIEHKWVEQVEQMLAEAGADVVAESVRTDIAHELEAGHEVVLTAVDTGDTLAAGRLTTSDDRSALTGMVATADDVTAFTAELTTPTPNEGDGRAGSHPAATGGTDAHETQPDRPVTN